MLATDEDREGEAIAFHVKKVCDIPDNKYCRVTYRSVTKEAIKQGIENARLLDMNLVYAAIARQIIDKLIGYGISPDLRRAIGAKSAGRCQSIGLKLVTDREHEISVFIPEHFFDLYLTFTKGTTDFKARYIGTDLSPLEHFRDIKDVNKVVVDCGGNKFIVKKVSRRDKNENPKPPFCTATFQQEAATRLGLKVKDAMSCAQKLFEGISVGGSHTGLITYMRTDATDLAEDFIPTLKSYVEAAYGKGTFNTPRKGKKSNTDQEGHEALRCVDPDMTPEMLSKYISNDLLIKVYRLIWQRTIASAMPAATISETTYEIYNGDHKFILVSNELINPGYRSVYSYLEEGDTENSVIKETFKENEILQNTNLENVAKETKPKPRYTDATLVKELQKRGIGRPSTFATIVETVMSVTRGYTTLESKYVVPTTRGLEVSSYLDRNYNSVINFDFTKDMEDSLDLIAQGKLDYKEYLATFFKVLETAIKANPENTTSEADADVKCPKCGGSMVLRRNKWGKYFYGCASYPSCVGNVNKN